MAVGTETYKTLYGDHEVKIFTGIEVGKAADKVNDVIKSMADTIEALEDGVTGERGSVTFTGSAVTGTGTNISAEVTGSQKDDHYINNLTWNYYTATAENKWDYKGNIQGPEGNTSWTEGTLNDGSNTLTNATSLYSATGMAAASITVGSSWATGHTARVGITFAASSTFSYPSGWVCVGDDCSGGDFTFSQGSSYWLTIEARPDSTWMTCQKVPA